MKIQLLAVLLLPNWLFSQNISYHRSIIDTLCSKTMAGRGYVDMGDSLAADFIVSQFKKNSLEAFDGDYLQNFSFDINTFPDIVELKINQKKAVPGKNFLIKSDAPSIKGKYKATDLRRFSDSILLKMDLSDISKNHFIVLNENQEIYIKEKIKSPKGLIIVSQSKLMWHVAYGREQAAYPTVYIDSSLANQPITKVTININARFLKNRQTQNVIAYIKGYNQADSFIVISAHYDHLGKMGKDAYFPGANDNASGVAMMLHLSQKLSILKNKYSIVFIGFGAEEVGILGSKYFTEHPLFPLNHIKFLINLDLVGTGDEGIKVVNGSVFKHEFQRLKTLNDEKAYLKQVSARGAAANSDHYFFYINQVKCFFIYTLGGITEYHSIFDKAETLPLTEFSDLSQLIIDFIKDLEK